jgi:cysteine desulfurase
LEKQGWRIDRLPVSAYGVARLDRLAELLTPQTALVSVMLGNNETGVLQPVAEMAAACRAAGVPMHTDAVQVVGKLPVDFRRLGVDVLTATAHKFHGPGGIGVAIVRGDLEFEPLMWGGFQQGGVRPGTESVPLAVGMYVALEKWEREQTHRRSVLVELRDSLEGGLRAQWPDLVVNGIEADRLPHTSNISFPGLDRQALLMALDMAGVACSTGSACASGSNEPSPVLLAMGCDEAVVGGSLRFSMGATTTADEICQAVARILKVVNDLHRQTGAGKKAAGKISAKARQWYPKKL